MQRIELRAVHHSYDGVRDALHDVTFDVRAGQVLALIGPNGAGKSTTLRILATLQRPDRGEVRWDGRDAWPERNDLRRRIGFLGDGTGLYPHMPAAAYLRFFAECYGLDDAAAKQRTHELLEMFDLVSKAEARIDEMSKGMRQRLAIARTLVHRPELLLLDEPADGLDPAARRHLRGVLRKIADDGVAVVVSSHILRELDGFCDTVALLQRGRIEVFGPVDDVIERYEVGRRVHELRITSGLQRALELLRTQEVLVEGLAALHRGDSFDPTTADAGCLLVRIHGPEDRPAAILKQLVLADIGVAELRRVRSDLEDVYQSLGRDEVS
jgi:ABC-2 type transport system ATP-binding protein